MLTQGPYSFSQEERKQFGQLYKALSNKTKTSQEIREELGAEQYQRFVRYNHAVSMSNKCFNAAQSEKNAAYEKPRTAAFKG